VKDVAHVWNRSECIKGFVGGNPNVRKHMEISLIYLKEIGTVKGFVGGSLRCKRTHGNFTHISKRNRN
jgi:hypothetical protein